MLSCKKYSAPYIRGVIATEGSVHLKPSGVLSHVAISTKDLVALEIYKAYLQRLGITSTKYQERRAAFPIYGKKNFVKMIEYDLLSLHPIKN